VYVPSITSTESKLFACCTAKPSVAHGSKYERQVLARGADVEVRSSCTRYEDQQRGGNQEAVEGAAAGNMAGDEM
jgi:hypothetical protein